MQHVHDRQDDVQPHEVRQFQRAHRMVGAQLQRLVDRGDVPDALVQGVDRLIDHRHQDAVDDEGGEVLGIGRGLAQRLGEGDGRFIGGGRGGDAAHDLDQLHHRCRLHEMQADEPVRPVRDRGQPGDRDRGGIGGQQGVRTQMRDEIGQDRLLDGLILDSGLDHQVRLGGGGQRGCGRDARKGGVGCALVGQAATHLPGQAGRDGGLGLGHAVGGGVVKQHLIAARGHGLGDACAHLACADDGDGSDRGHGVRIAGGRKARSERHLRTPAGRCKAGTRPVPRTRPAVAPRSRMLISPGSRSDRARSSG